MNICYKVFCRDISGRLTSCNKTSYFNQGYYHGMKNHAIENTLLFVFKRLKDAHKFDLGEHSEIWLCECDELIKSPEYISIASSKQIREFWDNYDRNLPTPNYILRCEPPEGTYFTEWVIPLHKVDL